MTDVSGDDLATSAEREWANLVTTAVLGTDRRPLPAPPPGWEPLRADDDAAVQLLNRSAAVATARRAGVRPDPAPLTIPPAPVDGRPICSVAATGYLTQMLSGGAHDILLPEWLSLCGVAGLQPPLHLTPTLLLRGRRNPAFDVVARALIGARAGWLADAMPELGLAQGPKRPPAGAEAFLPPPAPPDSGAVVTAIVQTFLDRSATWAAVAHLRIAVAAIDPSWLSALALELQRAPFHAVTERTRVDLLDLTRTRREMIDSLTR